MKGYIEFDLEEEEDRQKHEIAVNSVYVNNALYALDQTLRSMLKHNTNSFFGSEISDKYDLAEKIRNYLNKECIYYE